MKTIAAAAAALLALSSLAFAQNDKAGKEDESATRSPWSGQTIDRNTGGVGSRTSIIKKDIGDGWSVGGQLTTKYEDPVIGGTGAPPPQPFGSRDTGRSSTIFGPYFEKKF
jgi:hypothetical protein